MKEDPAFEALVAEKTAIFVLAAIMDKFLQPGVFCWMWGDNFNIDGDVDLTPEERALIVRLAGERGIQMTGLDDDD